MRGARIVRAPKLHLAAEREEALARSRRSRRDLGNLGADRDHRIDEPVELFQRFAFRWFNHHRAGYGDRYRWCVEPVVHQALGDVFDFNAGALLQRSTFDDTLVGHKSGLAFVENREVRIDFLGDVVGVEDREPKHDAAMEGFGTPQQKRMKYAG